MLTWDDVINDKSLRDLPYKIELNRYGKIEMSPASNRHALLRGELMRLIQPRQPAGTALSKCSVQTPAGVKVPDVAWCSYDFFALQGDQTPFSVAPEICIEVVSPSNAAAEMEEKTALYFAAGAHEVWLVGLDGDIRVFGPEGARPRSQFADFPARIELPCLRRH